MTGRGPAHRLNIDQLWLIMSLGTLGHRRLDPRRLTPIVAAIGFKLPLAFQVVAACILLLLFALHVVLGRGEAIGRSHAEIRRALSQAQVLICRYLLELTRGKKMLPYLLALCAHIANQLLLSVVAAEVDGPVA